MGDDVTTFENARITRGAEIGSDTAIMSEAPVRPGARVPPDERLAEAPRAPARNGGDPSRVAPAAEAPAKPVVRGAGQPVGGRAAAGPEKSPARNR